jgi:hypothetical protein
MTAPRRDGRHETEFLKWLRLNKEIDSKIHRITANDVDVTLHKYKAHRDGMGGREVQLMMNVEVKTFGAVPNPNQAQTTFFQHQFLDNRRRLLVDSKTGKKHSVWHFGYYVLVLDKDKPEDGCTVRWCVFLDNGNLSASRISTEELEAVLRFDLRPDTLQKLELRRHHLTRRLAVLERVPLGFETLTTITQRS